MRKDNSVCMVSARGLHESLCSPLAVCSVIIGYSNAGALSYRCLKNRRLARNKIVVPSRHKSPPTIMGLARIPNPLASAIGELPHNYNIHPGTSTLRHKIKHFEIVLDMRYTTRRHDDPVTIRRSRLDA